MINDERGHDEDLGKAGQLQVKQDNCSKDIQQDHLQQKVQNEQNDKDQQPQQNQQLNQDNQVVNQENQQNQHNNQQDDYDSNEYGQYGQYDQNQYGMLEDESSLPNMQKRISSDDNKQYQMQDLLKIIQKQLKSVIQLTGFNHLWALLYFESSGWKQQLVIKFIDENNTHLKLINFIPDSQLNLNAPKSTCEICYLEDQPMIKNLCGHTYCSQCWKLHLKEKLKTFNKDPFPPCINEECKNRTAPVILEHFSTTDNEFNKLYNRTLCRSYAYGSPYVKLCKGRKGFSCDTCFKIKKMFELLQCQECGNFVCAKCGDEYHQPSQCFDKKNWTKLADEAFVNFEMTNATACPTCKQMIHKYIGCNYIKCICKEQFCYVCGQKWLPHHNDHFNCYRAKEMGALLAEKQKKLQDQKKYLQKLEQEKKEVVKYEQRLINVQKIDLKQMQQKLVTKFKILSNDLDYLVPLQKALKVALLIQKSIRIAKYFDNQDAIKLSVLNTESIIKEIQDFLLVKIPTIFQSAQMLEKQTVPSDIVYYKGVKIVPREEFRKDKEKMVINMKFLQKWIKQL